MPVQRLFSFLGWPVTAGLLVAVLLLLLFPGLRQNSDSAPSSPAPAASGNWEPVSYSDAVNKAAPSVVNIYTTKLVKRRYRYSDHPLYRHLFNNANTPQQVRMQSTLGSGVIVSKDGHILTNNHVISGADEIIVLLHDGRETAATLVGTDPDNDIAVLKIELENLTAITMGEPVKAQVGDVVLAIGNPFGVGQSVSLGIISATGRYGLRTNNEYENYIQTDAAINPGNSGGALIDARGNLLGISTAVLDETDSSAGISFAIPADSAMKSLEQIVQHGSVVRGWLGLDANQLSPEGMKRYGTAGIIVMAVLEGSPADRANLKPGDIITHINNQSVADARQGLFLVADITPGSEVNLRVVREGETLELVAIAGVRPSARTRT